MPPLFLGDYELQPTDSYLTALAFVMNPQSYGEVTLNSANPSDAPRIQPNLVAHPYDRRVLIEAVRKAMDLFEAPVFKKSSVKMVGCPKYVLPFARRTSSLFLIGFWQQLPSTQLVIRSILTQSATEPDQMTMFG